MRAVVPGRLDFLGNQIFKTRIGDVGVENAFREGVLPGIEIVNRQRQRPGINVHQTTVGFLVGTTDVHGSRRRQPDGFRLAGGKVIFHEVAENPVGINDEQIMFAPGDVLDGIGGFGNDGFRVLPVGMLHARADDLVFRRVGMGHGVNVIAIERIAAHEVVRRLAKHVPLDFLVLQLAGRSVEQAHLILHSGHRADEIIGKRFLDGSGRPFLGGDAKFRVTFIAENVAVGGESVPSWCSRVWRFSSMPGLLMSVILLAS